VKLLTSWEDIQEMDMANGNEETFKVNPIESLHSERQRFGTLTQKRQPSS